MIEIKRILCPIDFSDHSRHALDHAVTIARWYESTITMLHVCTAVPVAAYAPGTPILPSAVLTPADRDELRASMKRFADDEGVSDLPVQMEVIEGNTVGEILATAERLPSDLLVMGMRGGHARPLVAHRIRDAAAGRGGCRGGLWGRRAGRRGRLGPLSGHFPTTHLCSGGQRVGRMYHYLIARGQTLQDFGPLTISVVDGDRRQSD